MTRIVAIANQKGGVGKTTTAVNLGACLATLGIKALVIDFDPQCNTTSGLGMRDAGEQKNIYLAFVQGKNLLPHIVQTDYPNLWLVPSTPDLSGAEVELQDDGDKFYVLKKLLDASIVNYDIVLIDCPPSLSLLTVNALAAAHSILIPIQCEYYGLEGLGQLTRTIDLIQKKLNPSLEIEGILLTMCDMRTNLAQQVAFEVRQHFGNKVYSTFIPRNVRLSEAPGFGKPITNYDPASTGAKSYMDFAKEFVSRHPELAALAAKKDSGEQFTHSI